jgi:2-polyprenyl-3-methyl-5-hydroxy-6-metoxy-1,4-benzoquinol methylase
MIQDLDKAPISLDEWSVVLSNHLHTDALGIWHPNSDPEHLSYPDDGHDSCMSIEDTSLWFQHRNQCISELLSTYPPNGTLFDIGGGNGIVSSHLMKQNFSSVLIEPGETGALNARNHRKLPVVICGSTAELSFMEGSMPAIGLFDVLEHIEDDVEFLKELFRLMIPNGRIYLTAPAHAWLWSGADVRAMHYRRYTARTLAHTLEKAGFDIEYQTGIFAPLIPAILIFRSLPSVWGHIKLSQKKTKRIQKEHGTSHGMAWHFLTKLLNRDIQIIKKKKQSSGASLLCVARKPCNPQQRTTG